MKKTILALLLILSAYFTPGSVYAQTNLEPGVCVSVYGGGVVCGAKHEVVDTALGDVNPAVLGGAFLLASGLLVYFSRKLEKSSSQIIG